MVPYLTFLGNVSSMDNTPHAPHATVYGGNIIFTLSFLIENWTTFNISFNSSPVSSLELIDLYFVFNLNSSRALFKKLMQSFLLSNKSANFSFLILSPSIK